MTTKIKAGVIGDGVVGTTQINDDAVTLAKMAGLARGKLIVGDASGNPSALALGSANKVLTSDGTDVTWATASGTTINNNANNRLITGSGTANTLEGESTLTYDGLHLGMTSNNADHPSDANVLQLGGNAVIQGKTATGAGKSFRIMQNVYDDASAGLSYISTDEASHYTQVNGTHSFNVAASGSADAAISFTEAMHINSSGNVGIGTTSPVAPLTINDKATFSFNSSDFALGHQLYYDSVSDRWERLTGNAGSAIYQTAGNVLFYRTAAGGSTGDAVTPTESMRIASDGEVLIKGTGNGGTLPLRILNSQTGGNLAYFYESSAGDGYHGMLYLADGSGNIDVKLSTNGPSYFNGGDLLIGTTSNALSGTDTGFVFKEDGNASFVTGSGIMYMRRTSSNSVHIKFRSTSNASVGQISSDGSNTTYSTSSDYRLKENVIYDWDATTRLKQLKPARFNFLQGNTETQDGFLAHEVQTIVPTAVEGIKDAVDENGDVDPQTIDHSQLVPLLVKSIQEQQTIIDDLKSRIETLEG